jgi:hypothetical protein
MKSINFKLLTEKDLPLLHNWCELPAAKAAGFQY